MGSKGTMKINLIVVDSNSTDGTGQNTLVGRIMSAFQKSHVNVQRCLLHKKVGF